MEEHLGEPLGSQNAEIFFSLLTWWWKLILCKHLQNDSMSEELSVSFTTKDNLCAVYIMNYTPLAFKYSDYFQCCLKISMNDVSNLFL